MPVRGGGRAQKVSNERGHRGHHCNLESPNRYLQESALRHHGLYMDLEELDEIEALLEREQELLGQQDHSHHTSVNLLHSPDQTWRVPKQFPQQPPRSSSTPRSISRTQGLFSLPLNQLAALTRNMTFSDAEEDHQGGRNNSGGGGGGEGSSNRERSVSRSRTESGVSNASTASLATPLSSAPPLVNGQTPSEVGAAAAVPGSSGASSSEMSAAAAAVRNSTVADMKGVDSKKIVEKLQQIQGYIQQTTTAMTALEQQGDVAGQGDIYARFATLNQSLHHQEGEYMDILARSLLLNKATAAAATVIQAANHAESIGTTTPMSSSSRDEAPALGGRTGGNQIVGIVGSGNVRTMQERLASSQEESQEIITRMRESIVRREDLMTRYKATRERLENLKKQRRDLKQEERRLLVESGSTETPSDETPTENPLPGAENWSDVEIENAITDFQALYDKVDRLHVMYNAKAEAIDPEDSQAMADINNKKEQILAKRKQLIDNITCLRNIQTHRTERLQMRRAEGEQQSDGNEQPPAPPAPPAPTPQTNGNDTDHTPMAPRASSRTSTGNTQAPNDREVTRQHSPQDESGAVVGFRNAMNSFNHLSDEMDSKRTELANLQKQLGDMKKLLEVTTASRKEDERKMIEAQQRLANAENAKAAADAEREEQLEGAIGGGDIVGHVNGRRVQLSAAEQRNPEIATKYTEIKQSKARLAMMEEALDMITSASRSGQSVRDALPPEYLAVLESAEDDLDEPRVQRAPQVPAIAEEAEGEEAKSSARHASRFGKSRGEGASASRYNEHNKNEESREISAMQKRLNKTTTRVSSINEGSRQGHEKGAIKKQPQALWRDGATAGVDPRVTEMMVMQEELRQKKNALEALMRRMGKPSSLNTDNISDNISDNVSESMDRLDGVSGTAATWGSGVMHEYSDNHFHQTSDEDLIEEELEEPEPAPPRRRPQQLPQAPKDRNQQHHTRRHHHSSRLSVNNLATPQQEPPKQNRFRSSSVPKAMWESVPSIDGQAYKSPSNTALQTQQTIGSALSQLNQVQDTINGLRETLRLEQSQYSQVLPPPGLPDLSARLTSPLPYMSGVPGVMSGVSAVTPMSAYAGLGSLGLPSQAGGDHGSQVNQQLMSALQQCFSQLQLHSLEIQALSKHLQILDRREQGASVQVSDSAGGARGGRLATRRSEEEEEEEEEDEDDEDVTAGTHGSYALHHNLLASTRGQEERDEASGVPPSLSQFLAGENRSNGVTNPIYGRIPDLRGSWGSREPTPGVEHVRGSFLAGLMDTSPTIPLMHLDPMNEERPRSQPPEEHHWASLASTHPLHQQTTDLLNNQVPPGTRANNYWDNFRSYSRQNLLSTVTKSNTSEHPISTTSIAGTMSAGAIGHRQVGNNREDKRFNLSVGQNNNNNGGGSRPRVANPRINNPRGANARLRNPVSSNRQIQNKHKSNNRNKQDGWWTHETNIPRTQASTEREPSSINNNATRGNGSDSDGVGGVALEVLQEAEALMRKHANHPEFLLQLFRNAAQITVNTDQHVAVALLQDLARQPHGSNSTNNNNDNNNFSLPAPIRDIPWRRHSSSRSPHHNIHSQENRRAATMSGSEVSDSGLTSDDEDSRALYRNVKNLSLSPGGRPITSGGAIPRTATVNTGAHPLQPPSFPLHHHFPQPPPQYPSPANNHPYYQQRDGNNQEGGRSGPQTTLYDQLPFNDSQMANAHTQEVEEEWLQQIIDGEDTGHKSRNHPDTAGSSPEHAHHAALNNDTEYHTFESLVSSAVKASVEVLQSHLGGGMTPGGSISPQLITTLHHTLVTQIQNQAQSLQLPQTFLFSVYNELKEALQVFSGKQLSEVINEVPSTISQVLLTQYCSVLVQRLRDNHPIVPDTPTKLSQNKQVLKNESTTESTTTGSSLPARHSQENTTATQTDSNIFSLTSQHHTGLSQPPDPHHPTHAFSLNSSPLGSSMLKQHSIPSAQSSIVSSSSPPSYSSVHQPLIQQIPPVFQSSGSGQWHLPMPNPSPSGQAGLEASGESVASSVPTPDTWAGGIGKGQAGDTAPSAPHQELSLSNNGNLGHEDWAEPEHEEAVMDDLSEPVLPVHDLAEADQSQDAGEAAEGDGEDSQAEGIQVDGAGALVDSSPELPIRLQAREKTSQQQQQAEAEGMVECEADEAEGAVRGAVRHHTFNNHQGSTREMGLDEVPIKLQSPDEGSVSSTPEHHAVAPSPHLLHSAPQQQPKPLHHTMQPPHSPGGSEG